jgi:hypothetical protein
MVIRQLDVFVRILNLQRNTLTVNREKCIYFDGLCEVWFVAELVVLVTQPLEMLCDDRTYCSLWAVDTFLAWIFRICVFDGSEFLFTLYFDETKFLGIE